MYGCKQLLATYPGFDRAVSGSNYLFGESVSLIDFIKVLTVFEFCNEFCFPPCPGSQLVTAHFCPFMSRS